MGMKLTASKIASAPFTPRGLGFLAIVIAAVSLFRDFRQDEAVNRNAEQTQRAEYLEAAQEHHPLLTLGTPIVDTLFFTLDRKDTITSQDSFTDVRTSVRLSMSVPIKNIGTAVWHGYSVYQSDTLSGYPHLRSKLFAAADGRFHLPIKLGTDYYQGPRDLASGESDVLRLSYGIKRFDETGRTTTMHILVLYENDLGHLFDSYYIARCSFPADLFAHRQVISIELTGPGIRNIVNFDADHGYSTRIYTESEANAIRGFYQRQAQEQFGPAL
jgi:hypothetical protein